jgi:penicillin-binding protein 2
MPRITRVIGRNVQPRVQTSPIAFSDDALAAVRAGMRSVVNDPGGTAYSWRILDPALEMAGKTGTAQVRVITREEHNAGVKKNETLPWKLRDHGLFMAYAPADQPRYACAVIVEHGGVAEHPQVQMTRDILLYTQQRDPLRRPTAYPIRAAAVSASRTRT